jgi:putative Mg2+ transporter-C (MgtC) family protein
MMQALFSPDTIDAALRLGSAVAIGGLVGLDRGLRNKPAGLRTHALVSLGAALMTYTGIELAPTEPGAVTRVLQGVIAGVGFLGGGVILRDAQDLRVRGLTTAASIWIVAGLGMACGAGHWRTGLLASAFTLVVLMGGHRIEQLLASWNGAETDETLALPEPAVPGPVASRRWAPRRARMP